MILYLCSEKQFREANTDINPRDIGLTPAKVLGMNLLLSIWDERTGRDDLSHIDGKHNLARLILELENQLRLVRLKGRDGSYITNSGAILREEELKQDITRLELDPDLEYSKRCLDAVLWFQTHSEIHALS